MRLSLLAFAAFLLPPVIAPATAAERIVDFRYGIPTWHQPLGIPEDWHKPMGNERGALLYDFGPGPYAKPITTVEVTGVGDTFELSKQDWTDNVRFPAVRTELQRGPQRIELTSFSIVPEKASPSVARTATYERLDGIAGAQGWAHPADGVSPEFRNTAWGTNRAIRYRVRVEPGAAKKVMLGFCESYKLILNQRIADMRIEGAPAQFVDLALNAKPNEPQVFLFDAHDENHDGWINLTVMSHEGGDPNTTLATIALFPANAKLLRQELVAGSLVEKDQAELRIACGTEFSQQPFRADLIHAKFSGGAQPVLNLKTTRVFTDRNGIITFGDTPFLATKPRAQKAEKTATGWRLEFAPGTAEVTAWVFSGKVTEQDIAATQKLTPAAALAQSRDRWPHYAIPYDHVTVGDPALQRVVDAATRTVYQARENITGKPQFNSSFTLYRGVWGGCDAAYLANTASILGDDQAARDTYDVLFGFQNANGMIYELEPQEMHRTIGVTTWSIERNAQLSGDWSYARRNWSKILLGVNGIRALRARTLHDPSLPYYGLFPPGFNDGGIMEITAEYATVYWSITGLTSAARIARAIDQDADAVAIEKTLAELRASFEAARARDQRRDTHGNLYLPMRVGLKGPDPVPPLAQWGITEMLATADWLSLDDPVAIGSLAMLESYVKQGLPSSTGWVPDGNWAGLGALYGHWFLRLGNHERTADILYAVANHASPLGTWVEEQSLIGQPLRLAGDQPHCWASTLFVRLAGHMLAHDYRDTLNLLHAVPAEWLRAGAVNRLNHWRTGAGEVTLSLTVSADGKTATLVVDPIVRPGKQTLLHTASLRAAGFVINSQDEAIILQPGQRFSQTFTRK